MAVRTWQEVQALIGAVQAAQEPGEPDAIGAADLELELTDAWRAFARTYGLEGLEPTRGSLLQVGGRVGIVVNLETLLGLGGSAGESVPFSQTLRVNGASGSLDITMPDGFSRWRVLGIHVRLVGAIGGGEGQAYVIGIDVDADQTKPLDLFSVVMAVVGGDDNTWVQDLVLTQVGTTTDRVAVRRLVSPWREWAEGQSLDVAVTRSNDNTANVGDFHFTFYMEASA